MSEDLNRSYMTGAGTLMEDVSAKVVLDPLTPERVGDLRRLVNELTAFADVVDAVRRNDG